MNNEKFGNFISELRKEKNMTQKELADKLNLTDKAISKWERGLSFPDITLLEPLSRALDITLVELIKAEKMQNSENTEIEEVVNETIKISKNEVYNTKKKSKIIIISLCVLMIIYIIISSLLNIFPRYGEDLKYSQEYIVGQGNIIGEVKIEKFAERGLVYEIGANKYGYAVFKDPDKAFKTLKREYSDAIRLIQREFSLLPLTKATIQLYKTYGRQVTTGTKEEKEAARFVAQFMDIFENSFK